MFDRRAKRKARNKLFEWAKEILKKEETIEEAKQIVRKKAFDDSYSFCKALEGRGYYKIGRGYYSSVYGIPNNNKHVLKVCHKPADDGWLDYVRWSTKEGFSGTFAPKVYSYKWVKTRYKASQQYSFSEEWDKDSSAPEKERGFGLALMERLDETVSKCDKASKATVHCSLFHHCRWGNECAKKLLDIECPGFSTFAEKLQKEYNDNIDLHDENIMTRHNGDVVIIDPVAGRKTDPYIRIKKGTPLAA